MPTNRKRTRRGAQGITTRLIDAYTRLKELEAMDLPNDDPRRCARGEIDTLRYEIDKAMDIKPWDFGSLETGKKYAELSKAAGNPFAKELAVVAAKRREDARLRAERDLRNGCRPWGVTLEMELDDFERRWKYRPDISHAN